MNKVYFVYQISYDEKDNKKLSRLGGPFSSQLETNERMDEYTRLGYDEDDLLIKIMDEEEYYYGKESK